MDIGKNQKIIIGVVIVVAIVIIAAVAIPNMNNQSKKPEHDPALDTEESITIKWSYIDGWGDDRVFIHQDKSYDSGKDKDERSYIGGYEHDVEFVSGSLPSGIKFVVDHDGWDYWGYAWKIDNPGAPKEIGQWSGTIKYTVDDDSKYNGSVHILHYTLIRSS